MVKFTIRKSSFMLQILFSKMYRIKFKHFHPENQVVLEDLLQQIQITPYNY